MDRDISAEVRQLFRDVQAVQTPTMSLAESMATTRDRLGQLASVVVKHDRLG